MTWNEYALAWAGEYGGGDPRRAPRLARGWHRAGYHAGRALAELGVRPVTCTVVAVGLAVAVPVTAAAGPVGLVICAVLAFSSTLAGSWARALAVLTPPEGPGVGQTVADRLAEVAWWGGFWIAGVPGGLVIAGIGLTGLHEYAQGRARTHPRPGRAPDTVGAHPTRVWLTVTGLTLAGFAGLLGGAGRHAAPGLLTVVAAAWSLAALLGLGQAAESRPRR